VTRSKLNEGYPSQLYIEKVFIDKLESSSVCRAPWWRESLADVAVVIHS
jgi:hypothetical protein